MSLLRSIWKFSAGLFAAVVILLALAIGLFRLLLPLSPNYQGQIEAYASDFLNAPVEIDRLDARWRLGGPELVIEGVRVMDPSFVPPGAKHSAIVDPAGDDSGGTGQAPAREGRALLAQITRATVGINALHWLRTREVRPGRVVIDGLGLEVERLADGSFTVSGRPVARTGSGPLPNGRFELINASITYTDRMSVAAPYRFTGIDFNVEIETDLVRADGNLQLPDSLGRELDLSVELSGERHDPETVRWQVYAEGDQVALPGWAAFLPPGRAWFSGGRARVALWAGMRGGTLEQASLQLDANAIALGDGQAGEPARYDRLVGRGEWNRSPRGWEMAAYDLSVERGGRVWDSPAIRVEYATAEPEGTDVLYASADTLRIEDLTPFVTHLGPRSWSERIEQFAPEGSIRDLQLRVSRRDGAIADYLVQAAFDGLGVDAVDAWPGARGLTGDVRADTSGGRLEVGSRDLILEDPSRFREPMTMDSAEGTLVWRSSPSGMRLVSDRLVFRNADFGIVSSLEMSFPAGDDASSVMDLRMTATDVNLAAARRYLPAALMKPKLLDWADNAVSKGIAPSLELVLAGPLDSFPFREGGGRFSAKAQLRDLDMRYARDWPLLIDVDGEAVFSGAGLDVTVAKGSISGNEIDRGTVRIDDLSTLIIDVDATAASGVAPALAFLRDSPLQARFADALDRLSGAGAGRLDIDLTLPMKDIDSRDVRVALELDDASFRFDAFAHPLEQISGRLRYEDRAMRADDLQATLVGRPVVLDLMPEMAATQEPAEPQPTGATLVLFEGRFSADDLAEMVLEPLAVAMRGDSRLEAVLRVPPADSGERLGLTIRSSLQGMAIELPVPMAKQADYTSDLSVDLTFLDDQLIDMNFALDELRGAVELRRDNEVWHLHRGGVALGGEPESSGNETGVAITGHAATLDLAGWLGLDLGIEDARPLEQTVRSLNLTVDDLDFFGQPMRDATIAADRSQREWLVQLSADLADGVLFVPYTIDESTPVIARFDRLALTAGDPTAAVADPGDPRRIPPVVLEVADFRYDRMQLGNLKADVRPTDRGVRMDQLVTQAPSFQVTGEGDWFMTDGRHQSVVQFSLVSTDLDATLQALDFESSVDADDTRIEMSLNWPDAPGPRFRDRLGGEVSVRVGPGRLVSVQPGAGRVFGLLSVTALPRRLSLDFRDVFDSGFGFDYLRGDFSLRDGNAYTTNLVLEGPAAQVGVVGRAGLVTRDYDQTAVVYARFGSTLPVAGAVVGGPAVGAALLVFSELFKKPLKEMARVNYRITGSWEDPQIERVLASDVAPNDNAGAP